MCSNPRERAQEGRVGKPLAPGKHLADGEVLREQGELVPGVRKLLTFSQQSRKGQPEGNTGSPSSIRSTNR